MDLSTLKAVQAWLETKPALAEIQAAQAEEEGGKKRATVLRALATAAAQIALGDLAAALEDLTPDTAKSDVEATAPVVTEVVTEVDTTIEAAPVPEVPPAPQYAPGTVRFKWFTHDQHGRCLAVSFLNEEDILKYGPNLTLPHAEAKKRGWLFGAEEGTGSVQAVDTSVDTHLPPQPRTGNLRGLSGAQLWGPRHGQQQNKG